MQARRSKRTRLWPQRTGIRLRTLPRGLRSRAFLCGLLLCCLAMAALRACVSRQEEVLFLSFPLETRSWRVSSGYGWRTDPLTGERVFHEGVDLACAEGTPVLAVMDGLVSAARRSSSYGNCLVLCHTGGTETFYAHLQYLYVRPGETVKAGQAIGTAGQTGRTTGPHLHFELWQETRRCDPSGSLGLLENLP